MYVCMYVYVYVPFISRIWCLCVKCSCEALCFINNYHPVFIVLVHDLSAVSMLKQPKSKRIGEEPPNKHCLMLA